MTTRKKSDVRKPTKILTVSNLKSLLSNKGFTGLGKFRKSMLESIYNIDKSISLNTLRKLLKDSGNGKGVSKLGKKALVIKYAKIAETNADPYTKYVRDELQKGTENRRILSRFKFDVKKMMRDTRVVKINEGVIIQHPIKEFKKLYNNGVIDILHPEMTREILVKEINEDETYNDNSYYTGNKYIRSINLNFDYLIKSDMKQIFSVNGVQKEFASIQIQYYFFTEIKDDAGNVIGRKREIRYSIPLPVFDDTQPDGFAGSYPVLANEESDINVILKIGYRLVFIPEEAVNKNTLEKQLKAFSPSTDRKYHEMTCASTSTNKLCIYETFLDIIGVRELKFRHKKKTCEVLKQKLKDEGKDIEENIKNGNLIQSLELLTKKYEKSVLIKIYNTSELIEISNGVTNKDIKGEELKKYVGKKCFLYELNVHVAPSFYGINESVSKRATEMKTNYKLRSISAKNDGSGKDKIIIGFDFETYLNDKSECVPYCVSLYGNVNTKDVEESMFFYGEDCVTDFCNFIEKISDKSYYYKSRPKGKIPCVYIYGFNNSNFDNLLIYKELYQKNPKTKYIFTKSSVKSIKYNNVRIGDIATFYKCGTLRTTCKEFGLEEEKGVFPYKFVNGNNLEYKGDVPELKYWNTQEDRDEYIKTSGSFFEMKDYTVKYCILDSKLVFNLGKIHIGNCQGELNNRKYNLTNCTTGANLALKMFQQCFLDDDITQSPPEIIIKEREAYKGGRTEKFKNIFEATGDNRMYYYDVNSSYPYSMTKEMPWKYLRTAKSSDVKVDSKNIKILIPYHLYSAKWKYVGTDNNVIPNMLIRESKSHEIIAVKDTETYEYCWGCELLEAVKNGFEVTINEINLYETKPLFKTYVNHIYNERLKAKKEGKASMALFYKLLLNSLYGKFGQKAFTTTKLCRNSREVYSELVKNKGILKDFDLYDDIIMIEYACEENVNMSIGKLVRLSSYIAAESRCTLSGFMRNVGHDNVYYCDTDSVFTTKKPTQEMISQSELGKWKEECKPIVRACFNAPKSYTYRCEDGKFDNKCKGIRGEKVKESDYYDLSDGTIKSISQTMTMFRRGFDNVKIFEQERTITPVNNKRIWNGNESSAYNCINDWKNVKYPVK